MSAYLMGRVFYTELRSTLKLTLLALADVAEDDGSKVMLGQARMARKVGCTPRSIRSHLSELRELGYIEKVGRVGAHGQDRYQIDVDSLPSHEEIAIMFKGSRPANSSARKPAAARKPEVRSTGSPASVDRKALSDNSSVTRQKTQSTSLLAFEQFYDHAYPRKQGRGRALPAFQRALKRASAEEIIAGAIRYRDDPNREDAFTAHPTSWLNRDGWLDDPEPARNVGSVRHADRAAEILKGAQREQASG